MPSSKGAKTSKHPKTRHHSNLRPKQKHSKDFLKVYYPYLPLVVALFLIMSIIQPWQSLVRRGQDVLPFATQMSIEGLKQETNERRAAAQQPALKVNETLNQAAQAKANDMVIRDYWSHNTPEGNQPWEFITNAGYSYKKAGENLAYGFGNEDQVIAGWMNSPGHRANLLDANYQEVGFGFAEAPDYIDKGPSTIVVAMYGQPSGAPELVASTQHPDAYNTLGLTAEPSDTGINRFQSWFNAPSWVSYGIVALAGALIAYLVIKHSYGIKRRLRQGEKFAINHPLLDVTILSFVVLGILVSQQTGIIR